MSASAAQVQSTEEVVVAYLGPEASYTHQAARKYFSPSASLTPRPTFPQIFAAVQSQSATYGILPVENSSNGPVAGALDLLARAADQFPSVRVVGEVRVRVEHCLVGRRSALLPSSSSSFASPPHFSPDASLPDLAPLDELHTHPQAWGQCTRFLAALDAHQQQRKPRRIDALSTSSAAAHVATHPRPATIAAISSAMAARFTGLDVIMTGLEDSSDNVTRFLVVAHADARDPQLSGAYVSASDASSSAGPEKALVVFDLARNEGGALADALDVFRRHGCNLTSINARPSGRGAWDYWFVVETVAQHGEVGFAERLVDELRGVVAGAGCRGVWRYWDDGTG